MDEIDRRILELLRQDSRQPLKTLAAELGVSRSRVHERIARLEADGVLLRFTIETAPASGAVGAICQIRLKRTPEYAVVEAVTAMPEVVRCYALTGEIDLFVELACANTSELNAARDRLSALPAVAEVTTHLILAREKSPLAGG